MTKQKNRLRTFYTLIITQTLSLIGSRVSGLAIGIWLFAETGNATPLALVAFFGMLPALFMTLIAGVVADRYDRRMVMALSDLGQAVGTLILLFSFASDGFQLWHLYLITFIQAVFGAMQGPAFAAAVTMLVPDEERDRANTLMQLQGPAAGIIAPAIAGLVYGLGGVIGAIFIDLTTFAVAFVVILLMRIPRPARTEAGTSFDGSWWRELSGGWRYVWARPALFWLLMYVASINFFMSAQGVLHAPYLLSRTGSEAIYGLLVSVASIGALVGGIAGSTLHSRGRRMRIMMFGVFLMSFSVAGVGIAQSAVMLGIVLFMGYFPLPTINGTFFSLLQTKVAPDVQGRVFSVMMVFSMVLQPLGTFLAGPLADNVFEPLSRSDGWAFFAPVWGTGPGAGMGLMFSIIGLTVAGLTVLCYAWPMTRRIETHLPDYVAVPEDEALIADPLPAPV